MKDLPNEETFFIIVIIVVSACFVLPLLMSGTKRLPVNVVLDGNTSIVAWTHAYHESGNSKRKRVLEIPEYSGGEAHVAYTLSFLEAKTLPPIEQVEQGLNNAVLARLKAFYLAVLDLGLTQNVYDEDEVIQIYEEAIESTEFPLEFAVLFQEGYLLSAPVRTVLAESSEDLWNKVETFNPDEYTIPRNPELLRLEAEAESYYNAAFSTLNRRYPFVEMIMPQKE